MADETVLEFLDEQTPIATDEKAVVADKSVTTETPETDQGEPEAPATEEEHPEKRNVPLRTFLDLRDELKEAKKKLKELDPDEAQLEIPDPMKQPGEFAQYQAEMTRVSIINERMNTSERFAVKDHGAEYVGKAREWTLKRMEEDASFREKVLADPDPYAFAIGQFQKDELLKEFSNDEEVKAYRAWKAEREKGKGKEPEPAITKENTPQPAAQKTALKPPKSIASQPSMGGSQAIPVGDGAAFDALFKT